MGSTTGPYFEPMRAGLLEDAVEVGAGSGHEPGDACLDVVGPIVPVRHFEHEGVRQFTGHSVTAVAPTPTGLAHAEVAEHIVVMTHFLALRGVHPCALERQGQSRAPEFGLATVGRIKYFMRDVFGIAEQNINLYLELVAPLHPRNGAEIDTPLRRDGVPSTRMNFPFTGPHGKIENPKTGAFDTNDFGMDMIRRQQWL